MSNKISHIQLSSFATMWKLKPLLYFHAAALLLLSSLFCQPLQYIWERFDSAFFQSINQTLREHPWWQTFWALASHKNTDWLADLFFLGFFIHYICKAPIGKRTERISQIIFCLFYCAAIIYFFNRLFLREHLHIPRLSPSLVFTDAIILSDIVPWISFKDTSTACFPGDHATTALLFAACYTYFAGIRSGLFAIGFALFLCFPRLITGAHWISDIVVGSGSIALIFLSWAFCTPLQTFIVQKIKTGLSFLQNMKVSSLD
ncbi:MAG TPA: phosphatase PAP2 family protein [Rhabdochlamydiaceae bacterium]|nr:phosphatase PAP2 family protein [Rhabdochlamydiaceae bacterium]